MKKAGEIEPEITLSLDSFLFSVNIPELVKRNFVFSIF